MASGVRTKAATGHPVPHFGVVAGGPPIAPSIEDEERFREIDCVRQQLPRRVIAAAELRATRLGTGADRVLIASGALDEETYLRALGKSLGIAFEPLDGVPREECTLDDHRLIEAAETGLLPLLVDDTIVIVTAPRGATARKIVTMIEGAPEMATRLRLTTSECFNRFVMRGAGTQLATDASDMLKTSWPHLSAATSYRLGRAGVWTLVALLLAAAVAAAPSIAARAIELMLALFFIAWLGLRLIGAFMRQPMTPLLATQRDSDLPVYTIICALYQEASSVNDLLSAIERLNYPHEKLDVILAVEADDNETQAAIAGRKHGVPVTVIPVPAAEPRTKPKALNVALPFARGTYAVIFDAEDRPEPDQLRCAFQAFRRGSDNLACVQARLCIDNTGDSLIARYFTAEYAGQFDVFLPGLTTLNLPLPLGGSSNHFRTGILRKIGGWDAYNVTEDADLGMRLARFGYRTEVIESTTYEEAPAYLAPWLKQRTRWFKGWLQTWLVHMREPRRLLRELGLPGFAAFQLMVGGNALAALVHPLFLAGLIYALASGAWRDATASLTAPGMFYAATAIIGYLSSALIGWIGLRRRGLSSAAWVLLLTPIYWLMLSLAAWRALHQLFFARYRWEKTAHGLAKTSHRATRLTRALLDLDSDIDDLKKRDKLPTLGGTNEQTRLQENQSWFGRRQRLSR